MPHIIAPDRCTPLVVMPHITPTKFVAGALALRPASEIRGSAL